jgi:hypothetical protein
MLIHGRLLVGYSILFFVVGCNRPSDPPPRKTLPPEAEGQGALAPQHVAAATADPIVDSSEAATTAPHTDEPPDGPKRIFKDDFIENLAGNWKLTRKIRGATVENTVKAEWVLTHQFLQLHMKDVANPPAYEAIVLIGYSYDDKRYIAHWCDTFGGKFSAKGFGQRSGDSIEFRFDYPDGPFFNTFTWDAQTKTWICRLENQNKEGKRVLFAEDALRRP